MDILLQKEITMPLHEGNWLKRELKDRGIRQEDFAKQVGISRNQLSVLMRDDKLSPKYRQTMLDLLDLPESEIKWLTTKTNRGTALEVRMQLHMEREHIGFTSLIEALGVEWETIRELWAKGYGDEKFLRRIETVLNIPKGDLVDLSNWWEKKYGETESVATSEPDSDVTNARLVGLNDPDVYQQVKFISYQVWATFTDNFGDFNFQDVQATYPVYLPRLGAPISDKHMVFEILGDSMEDRLYSRDVILTEMVDDGNIDYINSGIYVVAYRNQLVVKRVIDNDLMVNGTLTLHSDNKNHGKVVIRRDDIRYIWKFKAVVYSTYQG
jgi:phage repressor protein C with HTH and peptisase S24 domain/plasmid maintenance system antidote protein VapI